MNIAKQIAEELKIKVWQVEAVMELIDEGCTIPFIARYRKEKHGSLNDEQLRNLDERLTYLRNLEERKETVLASIEEQGKLTEELKQQILAAQTQVLLEDLSVSSETTHTCYDCKRKRVGRTGKSDSFAAVRPFRGRRSKTVSG